MNILKSVKLRIVTSKSRIRDLEDRRLQSEALISRGSGRQPWIH
jgi:hypothetical protein